MGLKVHESLFLFNTRHLIDKLCDQIDIYATYKDLYFLKYIKLIKKQIWLFAFNIYSYYSHFIRYICSAAY